MDYFQVRISRETAEYYQSLKEVYKKKYGNDLLQANIISHALDDVSIINNWERVIDSKPKINHLNELSEKDLRIRVKLSPQVQEKIQNYKFYFPKFLKVRSVSLGVTLNYIFKGAILVRENSTLIQDNLSNLDSIFNNYKERLEYLVAPVNKNLFESLFNEMRIDVLDKNK